MRVEEHGVREEQRMQDERKSREKQRKNMGESRFDPRKIKAKRAENITHLYTVHPNLE